LAELIGCGGDGRAGDDGYGPARNAAKTDDQGDEDDAEDKIKAILRRIAHCIAEIGANDGRQGPKRREKQRKTGIIGRGQSMGTGALFGKRPVFIGQRIKRNKLLEEREVFHAASDGCAHHHMAQIDEKGCDED
jgi:hypothetical protein